MTPQEINEAVAKRLGWKQNPKDKDEWFRGPEIAYPVPDYCSRIEAAWEIVESEDRPLTDFELVQDSTSGTCKWWAGWGTDRRKPLGDGRMIKAYTAPMAICLAFLKLPEGRQ